MLTRRLTCPACNAGLKVAATLEPGKKIRCPKCEEPFRVPDEDDDDEPVRAVTAKPRKAAAPPPDDEDYDDEPEEKPRPKKRRPAKKQESNSGVLILALCLGGLAIVGGGAAVAYMLWPAKKADTPSGGGASASTTPPEGQGRGGPGRGGPDMGGFKDKGGRAGRTDDDGGGGGTDGRLVYDRHDCARCHQVDSAPSGGGGKKGGRLTDLRSVGSKQSLRYIMDHIRDPKSHKPTSRMPAYGEETIGAADLKALGEYLAGLK